MNWKFENTGTNSGVFNMQYDEVLAQELVEGRGQPTIRVYAWEPYAISLGWNQNIHDIDVAKASAKGIDVVRRPTGGRAILHSEELTYSVVMHVKEKNIYTVYDEISRALCTGLKALGVDVNIEKSQPYFPSLYREAFSAVCFSSIGRYEIKFKGKKLVGSAQRRYIAFDGEEVVLQHGSIIIGPGHKQIVEFLKFPSETVREVLRKELDEKTIDLSSILNRQISFDEVADVVLFGFKKTWSINPLIINEKDSYEKFISNIRT